MNEALNFVNGEFLCCFYSYNASMKSWSQTTEYYIAKVRNGEVIVATLAYRVDKAGTSADNIYGVESSFSEKKEGEEINVYSYANRYWYQGNDYQMIIDGVEYNENRYEKFPQWVSILESRLAEAVRNPNAKQKKIAALLFNANNGKKK